MDSHQPSSFQGEGAAVNLLLSQMDQILEAQTELRSGQERLGVQNSDIMQSLERAHARIEALSKAQEEAEARMRENMRLTERAVEAETANKFQQVTSRIETVETRQQRGEEEFERVVYGNRRPKGILQWAEYMIIAGVSAAVAYLVQKITGDS